MYQAATGSTGRYPHRRYASGRSKAFLMAQAQARREQAMHLLAMERFCREYSPDLPDEDVAKMSYERTRFFPGYDPREPELWSFAPNGTSWALISVCIKEDPNQSYAALANRLAQTKSMSYTGAAYMVATLRNEGRLAYYDDLHDLQPWKPGAQIVLEPELD